MKTVLKWIGAALIAAIIGLGIYGYDGWRDAARDAANLKAEAAELSKSGKGARALSARQLQILLTAQDPKFADHKGLDLTTPGAGLTTLTQALAKRVAFEEFNPGIEKLRQTTYAMSLERRLTKEEILTLSLSEMSFGRVPGEDTWHVGIFSASAAIFGKPVAELSDLEFAELVARLIAPGTFSKASEHMRLKERARRILAAANGNCAPHSQRDVWLEGCAER